MNSLLPNRNLLITGACTGLLAWAASATPDVLSEGARERSIVGNPETLLGHYEDWKAARGAADAAPVIELPLSWSKGRSSRVTRAGGYVRFDLEQGSVAVQVQGLTDEAAVDLWLVEYADGSDGDCDGAGDELYRHLVHLQLREGSARARRPLGNLAGVELEMIVVAPFGQHPDKAGLLYGTPGLFERLYSWELSGGKNLGHGVGGIALTAGNLPAPNRGAFVPPIIDDLDALIAQGEDLFFNETFDGNGRTCGTCHPAENNFTIDVPFISALPANDPLFVAEGNPDLDSTLNGGLVFENPTLMRQFGLIVENLDGFGDLANRFTMRSVPHTLGMAHSINRSVNQPATAPLQRTGWSGDGAPGQGTLRDFAVGAVTQHAPKTLGRVEGVDFRLPTPQELTAMEAFQLSLGRPDTPDIEQMTFLDAGVELGRDRFHAGSCNACHDDGGAFGLELPDVTEGVANLDFPTAVETFTQNHPDGTGEPRPVDGGFGHTPGGEFGTLIANPEGGFGTRQFNVASLIEMADTLPAFHSNATLIPGSPLPNTVEGAVTFYTTDEFRNSIPGPTNFFDEADIDPVARFLRVLNALENERSATSYGERAEPELLLVLPDLPRVTKLADLAQHECEDAIQVLSAIGLHPAAVQDFTDARTHLQAAMAGSAASRLTEVQLALPLLASARADMLQ